MTRLTFIVSRLIGISFSDSFLTFRSLISLALLIFLQFQSGYNLRRVSLLSSFDQETLSKSLTLCNEAFCADRGRKVKGYVW